MNEELQQLQRRLQAADEANRALRRVGYQLRETVRRLSGDSTCSSSSAEHTGGSFEAISEAGETETLGALAMEVC
jgi:hypothetical protein